MHIDQNRLFIKIMYNGVGSFHRYILHIICYLHISHQTISFNHIQNKTTWIKYDIRFHSTFFKIIMRIQVSIYLNRHVYTVLFCLI